MQQKQHGMILIVDDDKDSLKYLNAVLSEYSITATSPFKAVNMMQHKGVTMLITDYAMPELDGASLCKTAKAVYNIPTIIVTGHAESKETLERNPNIDAVLIKPVAPDKLKQVIINLLDKYYEKS